MNTFGKTAEYLLMHMAEFYRIVAYIGVFTLYLWFCIATQNYLSLIFFNFIYFIYTPKRQISLLSA